jgi:1-acylglycerone phosphate reductase
VQEALDMLWPKNVTREVRPFACLCGVSWAAADTLFCLGLRVFATARRLDSMKELSDLGMTTIALDVTDISAIRRVRDEVAASTGGKLDILFNNA